MNPYKKQAKYLADKLGVNYRMNELILTRLCIILEYLAWLLPDEIDFTVR